MAISKCWRTERQTDASLFGKSVFGKISTYENTWTNRCYKDGIPDDAPVRLIANRLVPTYHALAIALLKNDLNFISLGFSPPSSQLEQSLITARKTAKDKQLELRL